MSTATTKYLQLPFHFEIAKLQEELKIISAKEWSPMLYKHNYDGSWQSIALYAPDGDTKNIFAHNDSKAELKPTKILASCDYLQEVIRSFEAPLLSVRFLNLATGSVIKPHKDFQMGYENHNFRIHIPITTNPNVSFVLDGEELRLLPGECWYINANFTHSVSNLGTENRVHLVIDLERNAWSDRLFFSLAPKISFALEEDQPSKETLETMIYQLEHIQTEASKKLIQEYRELLNQMN